MSKAPATKTDIIDCLVERTGTPKASATQILNVILSFISEALKQEQAVSLVGFGTFLTKDRPARTGRNPRTGKPIPIAAARIPVFRASKGLKDTVNCEATLAQESA